LPLAACRLPYGGDIGISLDKCMVDQAMDCWRNTTAPDRKIAMRSILRELKRTIKRFKQRKASSKEMDDLAADMALWLGHELLYADGEKQLVKGLSRDDLNKQTDKMEKLGYQ
jgi:hypothetical protein